jgi:hypothetical protein
MHFFSEISEWISVTFRNLVIDEIGDQLADSHSNLNRWKNYSVIY